MTKPNNVARKSVTVREFFVEWFRFLKSFHNLTNREIDLIAAFLYKRYELSKKINDEELLNKVLMSEDSKREIREMVGMTESHYHVYMSKLKKGKIIENDAIAPKWIPNLNGNMFMLLMMFNITDFEEFDKKPGSETGSN